MSASPDCGATIPHSRPDLGHQERTAVLAVLARSWVGTGGVASRELEQALQTTFSRPAVLALSSGSAALEIALRITDVAGELVAIPAFACASIERSVVRAGGRPHLVDVAPDDLSFPLGALGSLAGRCKAAILVHQFGLPAAAAMEARDVPMTVIEDATTCAGGQLAEQAVGTFGRFSVISFSATKMMCGAEGGALMGTYEDIELARQWANPESDLPMDLPVLHAKMPDLSCALAHAQLKRLDYFLRRRAEIAHRYDEFLGVEIDRVVRARGNCLGTWWRYLVTVRGDAAEATRRGRANGAAFSRPVPTRRWEGRGKFPVSDHLHQHLVSVPLYPALSESEIVHVGETLRKVATGE